MAKLKKGGTHKKSSLAGRQAAGKNHKPKTMNKKMSKALKNSGKSGKKV